MNKIVWKFSFWSLQFQRWLEFLEQMLICFKNVSSVKKLPISDGEAFLESIFDLNWTCKILLTKFGILTQLACFIFSLKNGEMPWYIKNVKKLEFEEDWAELDQKSVSPDNPMQNIWKKLEKPSNTGQDKESLISTFACFLIAATKV